MKRFTDEAAYRMFIQGQPLLSAANHLSLDDVKSAIQKLLLANQPEFAFVLAKEFMEDALDQTLIMIFNKTVFFQQMSLTNAILAQVRN